MTESPRIRPGRVAVHIEGDDVYQAHAYSLDFMIDQYLPATLLELHAEIAKLEAAENDMDVDHTTPGTTIECLMYLAHLHSYSI